MSSVEQRCSPSWAVVLQAVDVVDFAASWRAWVSPYSVIEAPVENEGFAE